MKTNFVVVFIVIIIFSTSCEPKGETIEVPVFTKFDSISTNIPRLFCTCEDSLYFILKNKVVKTVVDKNEAPKVIRKNLLSSNIIMQAYDLARTAYPNFDFEIIEGSDLPTDLHRSFELKSFSSKYCDHILFSVNFKVLAPFKDQQIAKYNIPFDFILSMNDFDNKDSYSLKIINVLKSEMPVEFSHDINIFSQFHHYDSTYFFGNIYSPTSPKAFALKGAVNDSLPNTIRLSEYSLIDRDETDLSEDTFTPFYGDKNVSDYIFTFLNRKHSRGVTTGNRIYIEGKHVYTHPIKGEFITDFYRQGGSLYLATGSPLGLHWDSLNKIYSLDLNTRSTREFSKLTNSIKFNSAYAIKSGQLHQMRMRNDTLFYFRSPIN